MEETYNRAKKPLRIARAKQVRKFRDEMKAAHIQILEENSPDYNKRHKEENNEEEGVDNRMEHVKAKEKTMIYEMENFERRNEDYAHAEKKLNDIARKEEQVARNLEKKKEILL